jgi:tungstate transport system permease protein
MQEAFNILFSLDREFLAIVWVSVRVSVCAILLACVFGIPFGLWVGTGNFKGRNMLAAVLNTLMALPTVVLGLLLYSMFSRSGPMGGLGILFTPAAMITGQSILAFPIIAALTAGGVRNLGDGPLVAARALGSGRLQSCLLFLKEAKLIIITSVLAGFGRIFSEVGVSMMLGGNIRFYTRNITTAIALETSKGQFSLGIALGLVLMIIAFAISIVFYRFQVKRA